MQILAKLILDSKLPLSRLQSSKYVQGKSQLKNLKSHWNIKFVVYILILLHFILWSGMKYEVKLLSEQSMVGGTL